jgi:MFS family permease
MSSPAPFVLTTAMIVAMVAGMASFVTFPALLPMFQQEWDLSSTQAGWISGIFFAGYVISVPILTSLTDRIDPRRVFLASMALSALATAGFGLTASGTWTASCWRFIQGIGFAGTYMPGLKAMTDLVPERVRNRCVAWYTATFTVGSGVSFLLSGVLAAAYSWRLAWGLLALGPVLGYVLAMMVLPKQPTRSAVSASRMLDFRPVLARPQAVAYMAAYGIHNAESSAMRAWAVALLVFSQHQQPSGIIGADWSPTVIAMVANLLGLPAILITNELARRYNRPQVIAIVMVLSALIGVALGAFLHAPFSIVVFLIFLYGFMVPADSGSINAGLVDVAPVTLRGANMALHALFGFSGAFLGPLVFGVFLDFGGGAASQQGWVIAFIAFTVIAGLGAILLPILASRSPQQVPLA